jgi:hypothetical protein
MNPVIQRETALRRANEVRSITAALKRSVAGQDSAMGKLMVREAIGNPPAELSTLRVHALLRSISGIAEKKTDRLMKRANVSPRRRLGELTDHERMRMDLVLR